MGNPLSPPVIKASSGFSGNTMIYGKDPHHDSTINFYIAIKNLVVDSTAGILRTSVISESPLSDENSESRDNNDPS